MIDEALQKDMEDILNNMAVWAVSVKFGDGRPPLGARYITTVGASDDEIMEGVRQVTGKIIKKLNAEIRFLQNRINFEINGVPIGRAPFPSMVAIFRTKKHETMEDDDDENGYCSKQQ